MSIDFIDGQEVEQTILIEDFNLYGHHQGTINVKNGCFNLFGTHQGTLNIISLEPAEIQGTQQGTLSLSQKTTVTVTGIIQGTVSISPNATLIIETTGKLQGTLSNNGTVIVRGVFGGQQTGFGDMFLEGNGYIKEPTIKDGVNYYEW